VLCWNISLAQYMRHAYEAMQVPHAGEVEIVHFAEFARRLVQASGLRFPAPSAEILTSILPRRSTSWKSHPTKFTT